MNEIQQFEKQHDAKVIYVTKYGSRLYGTDNKNSDTDYKGIFVPSQKSVLLKQDMMFWTSNSNNTNIKNGADDIDLQFYSIYKFFELLKKGETGALDILFSMFREDTIVFQDVKYTNLLREKYSEFYNKRLNSFVGYCVGQSKKYNIKGNRYKELMDFKMKLYVWTDKRLKWKVDDGSGSWEQLKAWVTAQNYKYIKFVMAKGPMTSLDKYPEMEYLEVLGSKYAGAITCGELYEHIDEMESQFGNRTKAAAAAEVDWKALSHAVRVILEVEELLDTNFITFPLREKDFVKTIKEGKLELELVMKFLDAKLDIVNNKMIATKLPEKSNENLMNSLILEWIK